MTDISVLGIHHVTAIASDPQRNLDFYSGVLGLRLVKRTVNFDDPGTYHFYFGDDSGRPGSILTFFPWPDARRGRVGTGQVAATSFAVRPSAIDFWVDRLVRHRVDSGGPIARIVDEESEQVLTFEDPDGLPIEIVGDPRAESRQGWDGADGISADHVLRGFHSVTLWETSGATTELILKKTLGFREGRDRDGIRRYVAGDGGPGTIVDVRSMGGFAHGISGAGTVHHVAWRAADESSQLRLRSQVLFAGLEPTPVIDRTYFRSVYFREPGGVLFELATDPPGFGIDEPIESLGSTLKLPPQYESHRRRIEQSLPPVRVPGSARGTKIPGL